MYLQNIYLLGLYDTHTHTHTHTHIHTHTHTHTHTRFISLSRVNIYHSLTKENEMSLSQESVQTAH